MVTKEDVKKYRELFGEWLVQSKKIKNQNLYVQERMALMVAGSGTIQIKDILKMVR